MNVRSYYLYRKSLDSSFTQADLAAEWHISTGALSYYISGKRQPPLDLAVDIVQKTKGKVTFQSLIKKSQE